MPAYVSPETEYFMCHDILKSIENSSSAQVFVEKLFLRKIVENYIKHLDIIMKATSGK